MLTPPLSEDDFAALMAPLGPFGPAPRLSVGVSGGPHSLALTLLAQAWARRRGGDVLALVADHGLRAGSAAEAAHVARLLAVQGVTVQVLRLGLSAGPSMQERARGARLSALSVAAAEAGRPWLLLGHHRGDQAETVLFRALRGSLAMGLAAMALVRDGGAALILRPLLGVPPAALEAVLAAAGIAPVRDPSNDDPRFARVRLRRALADPDGTGAGVAALAEAAAAFALRRGRAGAALAERLALAAEIRPEGFAWLDPAALGRDALAVSALGRLVALVGGTRYLPAPARVVALLEARGGTLAGAWLRPASRGRWLLARDPGAVAGPVPAIAGTIWDGRFRVLGSEAMGCTVGPAGEAATRLRERLNLPAAVMRALPVIRRPDGALVEVPSCSLVFSPVLNLGAIGERSDESPG
ncbi:tRNA lysidine(34) synthetase TilS [Roseomonas terrae]|jgi:tRNA(Ile)-lysidine synthase|uniref:tRNA(Ile)-lysidine synthase n=1 Tax=Neoroseomonas terrae TaxID=424799 RepID=A0ABS5EHC1_9PROT|nr:tRNA lysidine(34) synthetase TilS [Neoroseomonas terrae]MBR0650052.1 tRNA lysidine(34) synthetase TilS [Neoroseomonas terrae]